MLKRTKKILCIILIFTCCDLGILAQRIETDKVLYYFPVCDSIQFESVRASKQLSTFHDSIISIRVFGYSSPEGEMAQNLELAQGRAIQVKQHMQKYYPHLFETSCVAEGKGVDWKTLYTRIQADVNTPHYAQVVSILRNAKSTDGLKAYFEYRFSLMDLGPNVWGYLCDNHFRYLRKAEVYITKQKSQQALLKAPIRLIDKKTDNYGHLSKLIPARKDSDDAYIRPIALKTNLLFDIASLFNIEAEVPVAKRWSIAAEWIFPWWLWENKQHCMQLLSGSLETRYWFRPRFDKQDATLASHNPLTGWFAGVYGGGGVYDLEWNKKGYQGEFYIASGLSAGYVKALNRNISVEFSVGIGVMKTKYREYNAMYSEVDNDWHLIRQNNGSFFWVGPTKAKISFVWYPHFKYKR